MATETEIQIRTFNLAGGSRFRGAKIAPIHGFRLGLDCFLMANFRNVYNSLLLVIAGSTSKELARQIANHSSVRDTLQAAFERVVKELFSGGLIVRPFSQELNSYI